MKIVAEDIGAQKRQQKERGKDRGPHPFEKRGSFPQKEKTEQKRENLAVPIVEFRSQFFEIQSDRGPFPHNRCAIFKGGEKQKGAEKNSHTDQKPDEETARDKESKWDEGQRCGKVVAMKTDQKSNEYWPKTFLAVLQLQKSVDRETKAKKIKGIIFTLTEIEDYGDVGDVKKEGEPPPHFILELPDCQKKKNGREKTGEGKRETPGPF